MSRNVNVLFTSCLFLCFHKNSTFFLNFVVALKRAVGLAISLPISSGQRELFDTLHWWHFGDQSETSPIWSSPESRYPPGRGWRGMPVWWRALLSTLVSHYTWRTRRRSSTLPAPEECRLHQAVEGRRSSPSLTDGMPLGNWTWRGCELHRRCLSIRCVHRAVLPLVLPSSCPVTRRSGGALPDSR